MNLIGKQVTYNDKKTGNTITGLVQKVTIDFVVGEAKAPLIVALLISGLIGFLIGLVLPRFRRHDNGQD